MFDNSVCDLSLRCLFKKCAKGSRKQDKSRINWQNLKSDLIEKFKNKILGKRGQRRI